MTSLVCGGCSECCRGPNRVLEVTGDESATNLRTYTGEGGRVFLSTRVDGSCVYLSDGGCSIYQDRPVSCRRFDCRLLQWAATPEQVGPRMELAIRLAVQRCGDP